MGVGYCIMRIGVSHGVYHQVQVDPHNHYEETYPETHSYHAHHGDNPSHIAQGTICSYEWAMASLDL